jgi:hypothetical protein
MVNVMKDQATARRSDEGTDGSAVALAGVFFGLLNFGVTHAS